MSQPAPHNSPGPFTGYTRHRITEEVKGSYSDRKRALKWVLLVKVPRTFLDDAARLRTASVRQDQRKYLEMGPGTDAGAFTDCVRQARPEEVPC
jgi:hypothetical protein